MLISCAYAQSPKVVNNLNSAKLKDTAVVYKSPDGNRYHVSFANDPYEKENNTAITVITSIAPNFEGKARAKAKTSYVTGPTLSFNSINALINSLTADSVIRKKLNENSPRIKDEMKNVRLSNAYLFAIKKESDNDYHLIIGDNKDLTKATLLNAEVSGLPAHANAKMKQVRAYVEAHLVDVGGSSYAVFTKNPIPIQISGSVFYDVDHVPGEIGPVGLQPKTSWEIHPIASLTFKD